MWTLTRVLYYTYERGPYGPHVNELGPKGTLSPALSHGGESSLDAASEGTKA